MGDRPQLLLDLFFLFLRLVLQVLVLGELLREVGAGGLELIVEEFVPLDQTGHGRLVLLGVGGERVHDL